MQIAVDLPSELDALFGTVVVPEAVYHEAIVGDKPQASQLETYLEGKVRPVDPDAPYLSELVSSDVYLSDDLLAVVMEIAGEEWPVRG